ncbi:MAG: outer membrane protein assembly factor BamC [Methylococcales bacterium]|nr:outer membrane protein assembly factor BamC [Methylococcales bacterium]MCK5924806.1 outer membrane protein assembly factor BamC [Methylococcales bacterium]
MKGHGFLVKIIAIISCFLWINGCNSPSKYQDNHQLEQPPTLAIMERAGEGPPLTEKKPKIGLKNTVNLLDANHLTLQQPFDKAWNTLATALALNKIKISDRNRETGEYFVEYDPDDAHDESDNFSFFSFKDDYEQAIYKLTLKQESNLIVIRAEKTAQKSIDLLDDGDDISFEDKNKDGKDKLIRQLYSTLKNDLPLE